ncbi:ABC transporter ATP-binding protein [Limisalsivibrio acetivorans]|uniref:ABC transporter ATP-binding protein n=1 Tax=Limisalsivibrio acetivorans TaxID=1304888 RepID=UPI0003B655F6|nr:ABC transporter ATP-binding protein [Limisalsivibrio acetivorans]
MIRIESLKKRIKKKTVVDGLDLHVGKGKVFGLLGPNGAGKSTTIKMILGFLRPDEGTLEVGQAKIGYLPENPYYYDHLTMRELLMFSAETFKIPRNECRERAESMAEKVGMAENLDKKLRSFSKGMVQRSGIAAALVHSPELVILDEPMSGLDPLGRRMVAGLVDELRREGRTILFCSHILSDVERLCDEVGIMHKGKVRRHLSSEELGLASKNIEIYLDKGTDLGSLSDKYEIRQYDKSIGLLVSSDELSHVLDTLNSDGLKPVNIKSSDTALESIFEKTVKGEQ